MGNACKIENPGPNSHEVSMGSSPPQGCVLVTRLRGQQQQTTPPCQEYSPSAQPMSMESVVTIQQHSGLVAQGPTLQIVQPTSQAYASAPEIEPWMDPIINIKKKAINPEPTTSNGTKPAEQVDERETTPNYEEPTHTQEPDSEPHVDATRERLKSLAAAFFVVAFWVILAFVLSLQGANFKPADCKAKRSDGLPVYDVETLKSCDTCGKGTHLLPVFGEWEKTWPRFLRIILYLVGILWAFLGIGMVCDQFMSAIEEITSAERVVWLEVHKGYKHKFHVKCWNSTVANLTLMALGSSAPEILLSIIELVGADFYAGSLGPSTIVGSAAFNLLVITSVCVSAIPAPDTRRVAGTEVYMVTASLSLFAYLWLIIVLQIITPDKVDIEEAVLTLLFFPFLIISAFMADKGWFTGKKSDDKIQALNKGRSQRWIEQESNKLQQKFGSALHADALSLLLQTQGTRPQTKSRAHYRKTLMCALTSGKRASKQAKGTPKVFFGFENAEHEVLECAGKFRVKVVASRLPGATVELSYFTKEASARSGVRYTDVEGKIRFASNETVHYIEVPIIDDDRWEPEEHFFIHLKDLQVVAGRFMGSVYGADENLEHRIGIGMTRVTVVNDDLPGTLDFALSEVFAQEGTDISIGVVRSRGACGSITCKYATKEVTAIKDVDFTHVEGSLEFAEGETHKTIEIKVLPQGAKRYSEDRFMIELSEPSPGVLFDKDTDGGVDCAVCEVVLPKTGQSKKTFCCTCMNTHKFRSSLKEWRENFEAVWYCNGSAFDQMEAGLTDWIMHCLCLVWKVVFTSVPPASLFGGWPCFVLALAWIGTVTACIGDLASLLGCSIGLSDDITAITLVALGTSLPDTLASKTAAEEDQTADNSIGNVTGSNCVNVFLGLGLPWCFASIIWKIRGPTLEWQNKKCHGCRGKSTFKDFLDPYTQGGFMVPASSLAFSVSVFSACAIVCVLLLLWRRKTYGGELGGPQNAQYRDSAILASLWVVYITASVVQSITSSS